MKPCLRNGLGHTPPPWVVPVRKLASQHTHAYFHITQTIISWPLDRNPGDFIKWYFLLFYASSSHSVHLIMNPHSKEGLEISILSKIQCLEVNWNFAIDINEAGTSAMVLKMFFLKKCRLFQLRIPYQPPTLTHDKPAIIILLEFSIAVLCSVISTTFIAIICS